MREKLKKTWIMLVGIMIVFVGMGIPYFYDMPIETAAIVAGFLMALGMLVFFVGMFFSTQQK